MILLIFSKVGKNVLRHIKVNGIKKWVFLSKEYGELLYFDKTIKDSASNIPVGELLLHKAQALRKPVNDIFVELAEKYHSIAWWSMMLAEKNTLISHLFLNICYLSIARDILAEQGDVCVISDNLDLLKSLHDIHPDSKIIAPIHLRMVRKCKDILFIPYWLTRAFFTCLFKAIAARIYFYKLRGKDLDKSKKSVLIFTFINDKSFGENGVLFDRYFPGLAEWLKKNGYEVIVFPKLYHIHKKYKDISGWFKNSPGKFALEHSYYTIYDMLYPIYAHFKIKKLNLDFSGISIGNLNLGRLFASQLKYESRYDSALQYRLVARLAENGISPDFSIDFYENMMPQKMFRISLREHSKKTKIITYQHSPLFPNLLCMFINGKEHEYAPDKLVCSSKIMMNIFEKEGFPKDKLALGPSLRHAYVNNLKIEKNESTKAPAKKKVLVLFPLETKMAEELLAKTILALKNYDNIEVLLKTHPMMSAVTLTRFAAAHGLDMPENFKFCDDELYSIAAKVDCTILMGTTAILEFYVLSLPYINIGSDIALSHDPSEWFPECNRQFFTPAEIRAEIDLILNNKYKSNIVYDKADFFEPVNDKNMNAFVSV